MVTVHSTFEQHTLPVYQGFINIASNKRYFQDEAGQGFVVIGQNDAITWPGLVELLDGTSPETVEAYIKSLRANGINTSRVMIEYAQFDHGYFETKVGEFAPTVVKFWDDFIALAEKHGLYLLLTPYDTFWQVINWKNYPYNAELGGPCETMRDWLTKPEVIAAQKIRWEFMIQRWGGSPNILAWDLMNEIDLYWGSTAAEIDAYLTEMAGFVRATEMRCHGKTHLLTSSSAAAVPTGALGQVIYDHPALDFANTHLYVGQGIRAPLDSIECAEEMVSGVQLSLHSIHSTRPYFDSESGPIDVWVDDRQLDAACHRHMSWAHLVAGGAGSGMRWPYTTPHNMVPEFQRNLLGLAKFAATIDWARFDSRNVNPNLRTSKPGIIKTGCTNGKDLGIVWLLVDSRLRPPTELNGLKLSVAWVLDDGDFTVEVWDTVHGVMIDCLEAKAEKSKLVIELPEFATPVNDVALVMRKIG